MHRFFWGTTVSGCLMLALVSCNKKENKLGIDDVTIHVTDSIHDFGTYHGDTVKQHCTFVLYNEGPDALVIREVQTGCGCTTTDYPKSPIQEGDSAKIQVQYDGTGSEAGSFYKTLNVFSNAKSGVVTLAVKGRMIKD